MTTSPDYASFSKEQLEAALNKIDHDRFPESVAEIKKRLLEGDHLQVATSIQASEKTQLSYAPLLKKCASVLIVASILNLILTNIYLLAGSWDFNILPILIAVILINNGRKFAAFVRWCSYFGATASVITLAATYFFIQPIDLTLTQIRLQPSQMFGTIAFQLFWTAILIWLARALSIPEITTSELKAGVLKWIAQKPVLVSAFIVTLFFSALVWFLSGTTAKHAIDIAQKMYGPEYQYQVTHLSYIQNSQGKFIKTQVTVWNKEKIESVPINWRE